MNDRPKPNNGILQIQPYVSGRPGHRFPKSVTRKILLASNENPTSPSPDVLSAIQSSLSKINLYPCENALNLRRSISKKFNLPYENIICGNGSDELIQLLTRAFANQGDEVVFSEYSFFLYEIAARSSGAYPVKAPAPQFKAQVDKILECITKKTRIVILDNPGNPIGEYLTTKELKKLHKNLPSNVLLIIDSAYSEYVRANDYSPGETIVQNGDNVVMLRTFSKFYGLAGLRIGWAYASPHVINILNRIRPPFNANQFAQAAAGAVLFDKEFEEKCYRLNIERRIWTCDQLKKLGLYVAPSVTNFLLIRFPKQEKKNAKAAFTYLLQNGISVRAMNDYDLKEWLRISIGTLDEMKTLIRFLTIFLSI
jgi:histidinol-phosphate aminotransferase